jgi:nuclear transcription Y subunit beta
MNSNANTNKQIEFDRYLPIANISRIIKTNLPSEVKLSKEAKETFQECVSEFISFITSEASDKCLSEKRKTINGDDLIHALSALGFDHYKNILKVYLDKHKESMKINTMTTNIEGNINNINISENNQIDDNNYNNDNSISNINNEIENYKNNHENEEKKLELINNKIKKEEN